MKKGFYPKLAFDGIRKNKKLYLPFILTCIGMVMMYYIIVFLQYSDAVANLQGAGTIRTTIALGINVIAVFAGIFLFYTNSFLMRRRKKEFGLYNILGMGKRNIGMILFWEVLIIYVASLGIGLTAGILLSKLAELGMINIMKGEISYQMTVAPEAMISTVKVFSIIFVLLFLNALRQVRFSSAISLMRSENTGEKPPKANWVLGILGVVLLSVAYYIAVTIQDPLSALTYFFVAVVMVIVGTYLLMIAGSVVFCRILQKKKNYYYKANHFISVSSMTYRMKRNGAGLASICILSTMVLVMISATSALYFGSEDSLEKRYPREINTEFRMERIEQLETENIEAIRSSIIEKAKEAGAEQQNLSDYRSITVAGALQEDQIQIDMSKVDINLNDVYADVYQIYLVPLEDYNASMGEQETLEEGEALLYAYRADYAKDTIGFVDGQSFKIKKRIENFMGSGAAAMNIVPTIALVVPDLNTAVQGIDQVTFGKGDLAIQMLWEYDFDTGLEKEAQTRLAKDLSLQYSVVEMDYKWASIEGREEKRADYFSLFGGLFYLGIMLSIVFIFATVLIIYYKQISEGYEDQARFEIMQKVGMTGREIRKSINSQLLTVFFLPLLGAGLHLSFAFPMIKKLLLLFNLQNTTLFIATTIISFCVFALFYVIVYRISSNAYYQIVSGAKEKE